MLLQVKQNPTLPIQKQTTAAQTGKVLLPSNNKTATAKVLPTSQATGASKGVSAVPVKNKGRPKGVVNTKSTTPTSASGIEDFEICKFRGVETHPLRL